MEKIFVEITDPRTNAIYGGMPIGDFITRTDTVIPTRKPIKQTWIDRILKRQRMQTVWVNKRPVTINAMMRQTINCRCARILSL